MVVFRSRVLIRVANRPRLQSRLKAVVAKYFLGSVSAAALYASISQPTLWRVLRGQKLIEAGTLSRLRLLLRRVSDRDWDRMVFGLRGLRRLRLYERVLRAEISAHSTAYGMASEDLETQKLSRAAEEHIESLWRWGIQKGHHPERVRLAVWRVRAPFILGEFSGGTEPDSVTLRDREARDVRIVELGIKREKLLLRKVPAPIVSRRDTSR